MIRSFGSCPIKSLQGAKAYYKVCCTHLRPDVARETSSLCMIPVLPINPKVFQPLDSAYAWRGMEKIENLSAVPASLCSNGRLFSLPPTLGFTTWECRESPTKPKNQEGEPGVEKTHQQKNSFLLRKDISYLGHCSSITRCIGLEQ